MEVRLSPENEARLQQIAALAGKNAAQLVEEAADRLLTEDDRFRDAVRQGFASLDHGEFVDEQKMDARVARMLRS